MSVLEKVMEIVSEQFELDREFINENTSFRDDLEADSLDIVELAVSLEEEYHLENTIEDEELAKIITIGDLAECIENMLA